MCVYYITGITSLLKQDPKEPRQHLRRLFFRSLCSASRPHLSYLPVFFLPFVIYQCSSTLRCDIYTLLACPLNDSWRTLSGLTSSGIRPRCGLWPERWNSCAIIQTDCLLPVLVFLSCRRLEHNQRKNGGMSWSNPHSSAEWGKAESSTTTNPRRCCWWLC